MKCAVNECKNGNQSKSCKMSFFVFPVQPKLLKQWILFCGRKEKFNPKTSHICMEHFELDDFENNLQYEMGFTKRRVLKRGAVPTIHRESFKNKELYEKRAARIQKRENKKIVEALLKEQDAEPVLVNDTRTATSDAMEPEVIIEELNPEHENLLECKMEPEVIEEFQPEHGDLLECKKEPELIIEDVQQEHDDLLECKKEPLYNDINSELECLRKEREHLLQENSVLRKSLQKQATQLKALEEKMERENRTKSNVNNIIQSNTLYAPRNIQHILICVRKD